MLAVVIILVAGVVTWDLTHQSIPAGGVDAPVGVEAADGWMATLDDRGDSSLLIVHDLSDVDSEIDVAQPILDSNSTWDVMGNSLIIANNTTLMVINLDNPDTPEATLDVDNPTDIQFVSEDCFAVLEDGLMSYYSYDGEEKIGPNPQQGDSVLLFESYKAQIALVFASEPDIVHLGIVDGEGLISLEVNATGDPNEDEILVAADLNVDIENATITDISLSQTKLAATVDINATSRLVLLDTITGESQIISDHKFAAFDPHIDYGILMFSAYTDVNPLEASEEYSDREIYIHDFSTNLTKPLTADDLDQWGPVVLEDHYVYQQIDSEGVISVEVQPKEPTLQSYSSNILKFGVILVICLALINIMQRQREANSNPHDSELAS